MPEDPKRYSPTQDETNRARQQGLGVGQRDLDVQRDANQADGEQRSFDAGDDVDPAIEDLELEASRQGIGRRADKGPVDREHGTKTRARNKAINSGRPFSG